MRYLVYVLLLTLLPITAIHAQTIAPSLFLSIQPSNPLPGQPVTITAGSTDFNINESSILWKANNKTVESGVGITSITVTAPEAGNTGVITATVNTTGFDTITATTILRPAMIDLIWEAADSYTPPFYKGKALPSTNGLIKVSAIPASNAPRSMTYTWSKDDVILGSQSGFNKATYTFRNNELNRQDKIGVTGTNGNFSAFTSKIIPIENPYYVAYKKESGFIDYANGSSNNLSTNQAGVIIRLEPFFFSENNKNPQALSYSIQEDGMDITNTAKPNELSLTSNSRRGTSTIQVGISSPLYMFQRISRSLSVIFN